MLYGLRDGEVSVRQHDVLPDESDLERDACVADPVFERLPRGEVGRGGVQAQLLDHDAAQACLLDHERNAVDGPRIGLGDHVLRLHVAEEGDLLPELLVDGLVGAGDQDVGLDADGAQLLDGVLRRLRLQLPGGDARQEREVDVEDVVAADVVAELADGLEVGE